MKQDEPKLSSDAETTENRSTCECCLRHWRFEALRPIRNVHQRVLPGETMPAGECPACGGLCHLGSVEETESEGSGMWLVQRQTDVKAHEVRGSFESAVRFARRYCRTNLEQCTIFELPRNARVATVGREGLRWKASDWFTNVLPISPEHPEWERMWFSLYCLAGSTSDEDPDNGQRWQYRPATTVFSSGCRALDRILPRNGFHRAAIVEYIADSGSGATVVSLAAAREACREGNAFVVVDRSRRFNPPAAANVGIDLANTIFIHPRTRKDELWAMNQSLRCQGVGAVLSWPEKLNDREYRALQLAVEAGGGVGLFIRPTSARDLPTWSKVQLRVEALPSANSLRRLRIEILRCRNGQAGQIVEVEVNDETGSFEESHTVPLPYPLAATARAAGTS